MQILLNFYSEFSHLLCFVCWISKWVYEVLDFNIVQKILRGIWIFVLRCFGLFIIKGVSKSVKIFTTLFVRNNFLVIRFIVSETTEADDFILL